MQFFFDTEFIEDGSTIDLISIGIVSENGGQFYAQNLDCDLAKANNWVSTHVLPCLENYAYYKLGRPDRMRPSPWLPCGAIAERIQRFVGRNPVFWAYYGAYDWVALNQLYGPMMAHPSGWPFYCRDLRQWLDDHGLQNITQPDDASHHALLDAQWVQKMWQQYISTQEE